MGKHRKPSRIARMIRRSAVVGVLAIGFITGMAIPADAPEYTRYPPCATEDAPGPCYWDAQVQGNGEGRSFLVHANGTVQYL